MQERRAWVLNPGTKAERGGGEKEGAEDARSILRVGRTRRMRGPLTKRRVFPEGQSEPPC